nr:MAG TPA: hypothetical protein [Caudoviricetes sp.]
MIIAIEAIIGRIRWPPSPVCSFVTPLFVLLAVRSALPAPA